MDTISSWLLECWRAGDCVFDSFICIYSLKHSSKKLYISWIISSSPKFENKQSGANSFPQRCKAFGQSAESQKDAEYFNFIYVLAKFNNHDDVQVFISIPGRNRKKKSSHQALTSRRPAYFRNNQNTSDIYPRPRVGEKKNLVHLRTGRLLLFLNCTLPMRG